jgi:peptidoglycan/xylan/chitin deacetylase (PgdA/CDA1 family)
MYHSISEDPEPGMAPYYRTITTPGRFAEQMRFLKENGYRGLTLKEGLEWLNSANGGNGGIPNSSSSSQSSLAKDQLSPINYQPVVVTFDDGFRDFYTTAYPLLEELGFSATMFLPTAFIADHGAHRPFLGRDCLNWHEVRELNVAGVEFGSHTVNHPKLTELNWHDIESEIVDSKFEIEEQLGSVVTSFAYPYAYPLTRNEFGDRLCNLLQTAGYQTCVTTRIGFNTALDDPLKLKRLPINDADDADFFEAKLEGGYDWASWPQRAVKGVKALLRR